MVIYDVHDLVKIYPSAGRPANDHLSLQVRQGEIFGLLGANGAGKSTLVRQMVGLLRPTAGQIRLLGRDIGRDPTFVAMNVGYMPQSGRSLNNLTVGEALYFTAHLRGLPRRAAQEEKERLLTLWQIADLRNQPSSRLSGGQSRLLQLAVSMAASPPVLLLDEPTNDLDPARRRLVWQILRALNRGGTTIIFITHDALEAEKVIQRVGIMAQGKLVAVGPPAQLKQAIDQKLRLELFFAPGCPPSVDGLEPLELSPGRWLLYLNREQVPQFLAILEGQQVDDFRLYSATLEDVYLHYHG